LKLTIEELIKPAPVTAMLVLLDPTRTDTGNIEMTAGTGLVAVTVKLAGAEAPPPGAGFVTTTGKEPAETRSAVVSEMVS
jgi:predicted RNA methylase